MSSSKKPLTDAPSGTLPGPPRLAAGGRIGRPAAELAADYREHLARAPERRDGRCLPDLRRRPGLPCPAVRPSRARISSGAGTARLGMPVPFMGHVPDSAPHRPVVFFLDSMTGCPDASLPDVPPLASARTALLEQLPSRTETDGQTRAFLDLIPRPKPGAVCSANLRPSSAHRRRCLWRPALQAISTRKKALPCTGPLKVMEPSSRSSRSAPRKPGPSPPPVRSGPQQAHLRRRSPRSRLLAGICPHDRSPGRSPCHRPGPAPCPIRRHPGHAPRRPSRRQYRGHAAAAPRLRSRCRRDAAAYGRGAGLLLDTRYKRVLDCRPCGQCCPAHTVADLSFCTRTLLVRRHGHDRRPCRPARTPLSRPAGDPRRIVRHAGDGACGPS